MIRSTLSILGLFNARPDIFDDFKLPAGVDMDILEPELLAEVAELESLYTDPDVLKSLIGAWSARRLYAWTKLWDTTKLEYNPIWNKDGTVEETEVRDLDRTDKNQTSTSTSSTAENIHSVAGYNSGTAQLAEKDNSTGSGTGTGTSTGSGTEDETIKRTRKEYGNIGVTTTQHMIQEEREIADFDIYQYIITDFKYRFCVLVY